MLKKFVSNIPLGTGTNFILEGKQSGRYRAYFPVELVGEFNWRMLFVNSVNTTFADGRTAYVNRSGGCFRIISAKLADGGAYGEPDLSIEPSWLPLSFDGKESREVLPDERFWSDPIRLNIPEGHAVVFEWEIEGEDIPCTPDSQAYTFRLTAEGFEPAGDCPLPAMLGCDRPYKKRVAFLGDSITQGCGTNRGAVEMWAGRLGMLLGGEYAVWNLGLGYARAEDAASNGSWLWKAKQNDVVILTLGVNDLLHSAHDPKHCSTAGELISYIEATLNELQSSGVEVILSLIPPFEFDRAQLREWRAVELAIPTLAEMYGCRIYDIEAALDADDRRGGKYIYGSHPDGRGGLAAAEKFRDTFYINGEWKL